MHAYGQMCHAMALVLKDPKLTKIKLVLEQVYHRRRRRRRCIPPPPPPAHHYHHHIRLKYLQAMEHTNSLSEDFKPRS